MEYITIAQAARLSGINALHLSRLFQAGRVSE
jgi:hypothetical protein